MGFEDCKVYVSNVDSQSSAAGGIIIQVLGEMSNKNGPWRKFAQTFFLAEQPNGYFVLNDIFRYLKDEEETEEQAEEIEDDVRHDEADAREQHRDVAGAKVDISAVTQPGATPHVQPIVASESSKPAAIAAAPQDNSVTAAQETSAAPETSADAHVPSSTSAPEPSQEPIESDGDAAAAAAAAEPAQAAKVETAPAAAAAAGSAAVSAPVEEAKPAGPPKPKTWANLAASNATTWGNAVRADARGVSAAATPVAASQTSAPRQAASGTRPQGTNSAANAGSVQAGAVFIKNVQADQVSEAALRSSLERQFGSVKDLQVIPSRGCAFATFSSPDTARKAISASNSSGGIAVGDNGWKVSIEEKRNRPQGERGPSASGGPGGRGGKATGTSGRGGASSRGRGGKAAQA